MATNQAKRQQKLARKAKKDKEKRRVRLKRQSRGIAELLREASNAPVLHCYLNLSIWEQGIGHVLVSREMHNGQIAMGMFLVDAFCLGVKGAMGELMTWEEYEALVAKVFGDNMQSIAPADGRKLIEGVVEYAHDLGFRPAVDYRLACPIFGDIDIAESDQEFEFGRKGKPFFINGPNETQEDCQRILDTLEKNVGEGNFDYSLMGFAQDNS